MECPGCGLELDPEPEDASMQRLVCNVGNCDVLYVRVIKREK